MGEALIEQAESEDGRVSGTEQDSRNGLDKRFRLRLWEVSGMELSFFLVSATGAGVVAWENM